MAAESAAKRRRVLPMAESSAAQVAGGLIRTTSLGDLQAEGGALTPAARGSFLESWHADEAAVEMILPLVGTWRRSSRPQQRNGIHILHSILPLPLVSLQANCTAGTSSSLLLGGHWPIKPRLTCFDCTTLQPGMLTLASPCTPRWPCSRPSKSLSASHSAST